MTREIKKEKCKERPSGLHLKVAGHCFTCGYCMHSEYSHSHYEKCFIDPTCEIDVKASKKYGRYIHMKVHNPMQTQTIEDKIRLYSATDLGSESLVGEITQDFLLEIKQIMFKKRFKLFGIIIYI